MVFPNGPVQHVIVMQSQVNENYEILKIVYVLKNVFF